MRNEVKQVLKALIANRSNVIVDNDFECAFNIKPIKAEKTDLEETLYILESVLLENGVDIAKIYGDL